MRTQTPEIIIEGYKQDPVLQRITPDGILEAFHDTVGIVKRYLGIKLPPDLVRTIRFRPSPEVTPDEKSYPDDLKGVTGNWYRNTKQIDVYTDQLRYDDGFKGTLSHEAGHATLYAILFEANRRLPNSINCNAYTSASEAFAEWVKIITFAAGDPERIQLAMKQARQNLKVTLKDEPELLFNTALHNPYPFNVVKMKDASVLNYIHRQGYTLEELLTIVSFKPREYHPEDIGNKRYLRWTDKGYRQFKDVVESTLGVSIYKLALDAAKFYDTYEVKPEPEPENDGIRLFLV